MKKFYKSKHNLYYKTMSQKSLNLMNISQTINLNIDSLNFIVI